MVPVGEHEWLAETRSGLRFGGPVAQVLWLCGSHLVALWFRFLALGVLSSLRIVKAGKALQNDGEAAAVAIPSSCGHPQLWAAQVTECPVLLHHQPGQPPAIPQQDTNSP